jgi:hypothetical protein
LYSGSASSSSNASLISVAGKKRYLVGITIILCFIRTDSSCTQFTYFIQNQGTTCIHTNDNSTAQMGHIPTQQLQFKRTCVKQLQIRIVVKKIEKLLAYTL